MHYQTNILASVRWGTSVHSKRHRGLRKCHRWKDTRRERYRKRERKRRQHQQQQQKHQTSLSPLPIFSSVGGIFAWALAVTRQVAGDSRVACGEGYFILYSTYVLFRLPVSYNVSNNSLICYYNQDERVLPRHILVQISYIGKLEEKTIQLLINNVSLFYYQLISMIKWCSV